MKKIFIALFFIFITNFTLAQDNRGPVWALMPDGRLAFCIDDSMKQCFIAPNEMLIRSMMEQNKQPEKINDPEEKEETGTSV